MTLPEATAAAADAVGTDSFGTVYGIGDIVLTFANGSTLFIRAA